jgi:Xaa-Pro dipeptidase
MRTSWSASVTIEIAEHQERQARFAARLEGRGVPGAVVVSRGGGNFDRHGDVFYLTGHYQPYVYLPENPPRWSGRSHTAAVIRSDGRIVLCASVPSELGEREPAVEDLRSGPDFVGVVAGALRDLGLVSGEVDEELAALRRIKSGAEQRAIRQATAMGRRGVTAFLEAVGAGGSEAEAVAAAVGEVVRSGGGVYLAAASSGPMSWSYTTDPMPGFGRRVLEEGDLVRFDLVAVLDGYLTDFGRTVVVGEASNEQQRLLDALHAGLDAAIDAVGPGVAVHDVVKAGDAALAESGVALEAGPDGEAELRAAYPPHWGHGLGLGWERPWFVDGEDLVIEEGMYLAIERSLVMPDVGAAAAEQNLLVGPDGPELLTAGDAGRWS